MPDQDIPDQLMPDHDIPLQLMPDQDIPLQLMPDHDIPDQLMPDQDIPLQLMPDHDIPLQLMPDQFVPFRRPEARARTSTPRPRTSTSPLTRRPPTETCTDPRESSREPIPVETAKVCFAPTGVAVSLAFARLIRPLPCWAAVAPGIGEAVPVSSALISSGVAVGRCWISSAAAPETTAAACEVPLPRKSRSPMRAAGYVVSR